LLGVGMNRMREADASRIIRLIASVGPLPALRGIRAAELRPTLAGDKKSRGGSVRWVLVPRIGKAEWGIEAPWALVARTFAELPAIAAQGRGAER